MYKLADVFVFDELAPISGGEAFLHFPDKPLVVIHHALGGFQNKCLHFAALLVGETGKLGFQIGGESYFHRFQRRSAGRMCQAPLRHPSPVTPQ